MTQATDKKSRRFKFSGLLILLVLLPFYACPIYFAGNAALKYVFPSTICKDAVVPHATNRVYDSNTKAGETATKFAGEDGMDKVCTRNGTEVSREHIKTASTEVIEIGTKIETTIPQSYTPPTTKRTYRTGAICSDGSTSSATGRGACSWHGGVASWLYE